MTRHGLLVDKLVEYPDKRDLFSPHISYRSTHSGAMLYCV